jgi:hypothetical protein
MRALEVCLLFSLIGLTPAFARGDDGTPPRPVRVSLGDFEGDLVGWKYVGGEEFPGAKGAMSRDTARSHAGHASLRLEADFRGGGAYVGVWRDLETANLPDVAEIRLQVRAENLSRVGIRIVDATGQCHQKTVALPPGVTTSWQTLVLKVSDLVGGEHWAGANDGQWHGPPQGLGINIGKDTTGNSARATLWVDDIVAVGITPGLPILRACRVDPLSTRPGFGTRIHYEWDAEPLGSNCSVFVHFIDAQGRMAFQADHDPPTPTARWSGRVEYGRTLAVPTDAAPGRYDIVIGFWDGKATPQGGLRKPFRCASGLTMLSGDACKIGTLTIASDAPLPVLSGPKLDLTDYRMTFDESFDGPLSVSAWGPGTRWIAHTPYGGDFGDAGFADPSKDFPFRVREGILAIEARKTGDRWRSGLLCSVDPKGQGFSQQYGYFEMRAKLPKGLGTWPAFWLMGVPQLVEPRDRNTLTQVEIDVVEQYGVGPNALHTTLHLWGPGKYHWAEGDTTIVSGMTDDFHTYGVRVEPDFITYYFDRSEIRRDRTPKEAKVPLYLMVDLALEGGWPIDRTPNPSVMEVDYVRAYALNK